MPAIKAQAKSFLNMIVSLISDSNRMNTVTLNYAHEKAISLLASLGISPASYLMMTKVPVWVLPIDSGINDVTFQKYVPGHTA